MTMNENVGKVVDAIMDLLHKRIDKLKCEISEVCKSEVERGE
ncbi:hypothetical protein CLPUN_06360 [Clostridium puniceum]|uniref:Uncharacterized protein n=1 Tax=Clostridium puniceum TaxID=29367 RepID=A0A1S8TWB9_9CLOT|nr:hypothetical protein [Clostridium puniceum]OOM82018.1 hypothetical protein CLPUN_06360 [Clostridium puniceum]